MLGDRDLRVIKVSPASIFGRTFVMRPKNYLFIAHLLGELTNGCRGITVAEDLV